MFTTEALVSLSPIARRATQTVARRFMQDGPGLGDLGILPVIAAAVTAAGGAAGSYFAAGSAADAAEAQAEAAAEAAIAPYRYEYKTQKKLIAASRFATAIDAVSGEGITLAKDRSGLLLAGGIVLALALGAVLIFKGT